MTKCDANCPAPAKFEVLFTSGPLFFCGHHFNDYEDAFKGAPVLTSTKTKESQAAA